MHIFTLLVDNPNDVSLNNEYGICLYAKYDMTTIYSMLCRVRH